MVIIHCPNCGHSTRVDEALLGKKGRCKLCGHIFHASLASEDEPKLQPEADPSAIGEAWPLVGDAHASQDRPADVPHSSDSWPNELAPPSEGDSESILDDAILQPDEPEGRAASDSDVLGILEPELPPTDKPEEPKLVPDASAPNDEEELQFEGSPNALDDDIDSWLSEDSTATSDIGQTPQRDNSQSESDLIADPTEDAGGEPVDPDANDSMGDWLSEPADQPASPISESSSSADSSEPLLTPDDTTSGESPASSGSDWDTFRNESPDSISISGDLIPLEPEDATPAGGTSTVESGHENLDRIDISTDDDTGIDDPGEEADVEVSTSETPELDLWEPSLQESSVKEQNESANPIDAMRKETDPSPIDDTDSTPNMEAEEELLFPLESLADEQEEPLLLPESSSQDASVENEVVTSGHDAGTSQEATPFEEVDDEPLLVPESQSEESISNADSDPLLIPEEPVLEPEPPTGFDDEPVLSPILEPTLVPEDSPTSYRADESATWSVSQSSTCAPLDRPTGHFATATLAAIEVFRVRLPVTTDLDADRGIRVFVKVVSESGSIGWGEAVPSAVAGSTLSSCLEMAAFLREAIAPKILGTNAWTAPTALIGLLGPNPTLARRQAMAAMDMAIRDLLSRMLEIRLVDLLGGAVQVEFELAQSVESSLVDNVLDQAKKFAENGSRQLVLRPETDDVAAVASLTTAVTEAMPVGLAVDVDCEGRFSADNAMRVLDALASAGANCVWDPLVPSPVVTLASVVRNRRIPVALFQSIDSDSRLIESAASMAVDRVVLDVARAGGHIPAIARGRIAQAAGLGLVGSAGWQSDVGIAHLVATLAHLGVRTWIETPGKGKLTGQCMSQPFDMGDRLRVPEIPGCGVEVDEAALRKFV